MLQCRDTYWVEPFNHQLLSDVPKKIHFGSTTFVMRLNLALGMIVRSYDDNGRLYLAFLNRMRNVGRAATSECMVADIRWKDRRTPMKVLVAKTFHFVQRI